MRSHQFHPHVLRAYDIRGRVNETLNETDAFALGLAFAHHVLNKGGKRVVIGRDGRLSSPDLARCLSDGLRGGGINVINIGIAPTPMVYFADIHFNADGAIQVTGSHNPPDHNGFKMVLGHKPFFGDDITRLATRAEKGLQEQGGGEVTHENINAPYLNTLVSYAGNLAPLADQTVIWDCGNGAAGVIVPTLTAQLDGRHQILFADIDGIFPHHHPDPSDPSNLVAMSEAIKTSSALLGIGFDGDGDRIGVIDSTGRHITGDLLTAFLAKGILRNHPGAKIIFDVKASQVALDAVSALGGEVVLSKTGHSFMKSSLRAHNAPFGGEMSGHIFIADGYYGYDDAMLAAVAVLKEICIGGESITDFIDNLPPVFSTPELRIPCADDRKFSAVEEIISMISTASDATILDIITIDGIRVIEKNGWWLIRASNTGGEIVVRAEGDSVDSLDRLKSQIYNHLSKVGVNGG